MLCSFIIYNYITKIFAVNHLKIFLDLSIVWLLFAILPLCKSTIKFSTIYGSFYMSFQQFTVISYFFDIFPSYPVFFVQSAKVPVRVSTPQYLHDVLTAKQLEPSSLSILPAECTEDIPTVRYNGFLVQSILNRIVPRHTVE